jgi:hypothetical protein
MLFLSRDVKSGWGRQAVLGGFDSHALPPMTYVSQPTAVKLCPVTVAHSWRTCAQQTATKRPASNPGAPGAGAVIIHVTSDVARRQCSRSRTVKTTRIDHIRLKNWLNFRNVDAALAETTYLIGPNASGKSNFLDVFRFLRTVADSSGGGLQRAVAERGGVKKLRFWMGWPARRRTR